MDEQVFAQRMHDAIEHAHRFAKQFLIEDLPACFKCRVRLNASFDGNPLHADERVYPNDSDSQFKEKAAMLSVDDAVELLWREGAVPEWINVSVVGRSSSHTIVELLSCGRFTSNDSLLYHELEGRPPFHVLGPTLPFDHQEGERFSVFDRATCWSQEELEALSDSRHLVWSMELGGHHFDDRLLVSIGSFPALEILDIRCSKLQGPGLECVSSMPAIRIIRISIEPSGEFDLSSLPRVDSLEEITIEGMSSCPIGLDCLARAIPSLHTLRLRFEATDRPLELPKLPELDTLELSIGRLKHKLDLHRAKNVTTLLLRGGFGDEEVAQCISCFPSIRSVHLRGTNAAVQTVNELGRSESLEFADLVETNIDGQLVKRLMEMRPDLRTWPRRL